MMVFKNRLVLDMGGGDIKKDIHSVGLGVKYGLEWLDLRQEMVEISCGFQAVWWNSWLGEDLLDSQEGVSWLVS